jgi:hypothetical protein
MCAVISPLPEYWYVVMDDDDNDTTRAASRVASRGKQIHVKSIDFTISETGTSYFLPKTTELSPLLFARDISTTETHRQESHPSDPYFRSVIDISREIANTLTASERLKCCILPFFNHSPTIRSATGNDLYYFNFVTGTTLLADSNGEFVPPPELEDTLPGVVSGKKGMRIVKDNNVNVTGVNNKKKKNSWNGINKYDKSKTRQLLSVSVSTPSFLPPIPVPPSLLQQPEDQGQGYPHNYVTESDLFGASRYLLEGGDEYGGDGYGEYDEEREGGRSSASVRPRTRQALTPAGSSATSNPNKGALHVGFSGMARPLHLHGKPQTPWEIKCEEGRRIEDEEFEGLFKHFFYQAGGGDGRDEYVWDE